MIEIRPLVELAAEDIRRLNIGYESPAKYAVQKTETPERTTLTLDLISLPQPYGKRWDTDDQELAHCQAVVRQGYSLGVYDGDFMVALAIAEPRRWNRTLWIWEFHVAKTHQRRGIGRKLMDAIVAIARQAGFRVIGLETQNTNVPAITFYRSAGFEIEAIDLSLYTNHDVTDGEVAIFMKRKLV